MVSAELNLILCFITSAAAGLGAGFFGVVLSAADKMKRENGGVKTKKSRYYMAAGAVGSTAMGLASIAGLYFGPITLVTIIRAGTTLPSNAFFSQFFGLRRLIKDDYLGTLACVCGVVCFVCYQGPPQRPPRSDEYLEMFTTPWAISWNSVLFAALLVSVTCVVFYELKGGIRVKGVVSTGRIGKAVAVAMVVACASCYMDIAIKGWSSTLHAGGSSKTTPSPRQDRLRDDGFSTALFWVAFISNVIFLIIMRLGMIFGCARCDVLLFVPLSQVLNVFLSVSTGMIVLDEGRDIYSWTGLLFSSISVFAGLLMLIHGPGGARGSSTERAGEVPEAAVEHHAHHAAGLGPPDLPVPTATLSYHHPPQPAASEASLDVDLDDDERGESESDETSEDGEELPDSVAEYSNLFIPRPMTLLRLNEWHERAALVRDKSHSELEEYRRRGRLGSAPEDSSQHSSMKAEDLQRARTATLLLDSPAQAPGSGVLTPSLTPIPASSLLARSITPHRS